MYKKMRLNMPSYTFYNLKDDKKNRIISSLRKTFATKTIFEASVKEIVTDLNISRGSFYQYFDGIEDAYFMILDMETVDIHRLFQTILRGNDYKIFESLDTYAKELSKILFEKENYAIYKNRFLHWNWKLEKNWQKYKKENSNSTDFYDEKFEDNEATHFIKAAVHDLIERNYVNGWSREEFIEKFGNYIAWIKGGVRWD